MIDISLKDIVTIAISVLSLGLSIYALWIVQFNRGTLKMTRPTFLCLKREFPRGTPKFFLRTLLFTTGPKGLVVENMFVRIRQPHGLHTFDFWGHTQDGKLTLGSGIFVSSTGIVCDHHFNPRHDLNDFLFEAGEYHADVFATVVGHKQPLRLTELTFNVDGQQAAELIQMPRRQLYLCWNVDTRRYDGEIEDQPA